MLQFDEKNHIYTLDDKPVTGVTTILKVINKPALLQWAANCAADFASAMINSGNEYTEDELAEIFKKAKTAYRKKADRAADTGTETHAIIETLINNAIKNSNGFIKEDFIVDKQLNPEVVKMVENFVKWAKENVVKFLSSEQRVFSKKHWYAGTYDFDCEINGKIYLGDLKTSSGIYPEMFFQTAAYQQAIQEMNEPNEVPIQGNIIVNCKKDGKIDVQMTEEYEQNLKAFMGALAIYRRMGELGLNN